MTWQIVLLAAAFSFGVIKAVATIWSSTHNFTLVLHGLDEITDDIERSLFEADCDDATLSQQSRRL